MRAHLRGKTDFIFSRDPALDRESDKAAAAVAAFNAEPGEERRKAIPLKNGRQPVTWHVSSLTDRTYAELSRVALFELQAKLPRGMSALADEATYLMDRTAVLHGLVAATDATDADGRPLKIETEDVNGIKVVSAATMEALFLRYGPRLINELGKRIVELTELDPT
jgi:hypothetical protein